MSEAPAFERLLKRDRTVTLAGLAALCALAWFYIVTGAGLGMSAWEMTALALFSHQQAHDMMPDMRGMDMAATAWGFTTWALMCNRSGIGGARSSMAPRLSARTMRPDQSTNIDRRMPCHGCRPKSPQSLSLS